VIRGEGRRGRWLARADYMTAAAAEDTCLTTWLAGLAGGG
jgi:hypothetical protein